MDEQPVKRKRGNPNFQKKKTPADQADNKTTIMEVTQETAEDPKVTGTEEVKTLPSNIFSDDMPKDDLRPMDGPMKEKEYANIPTPEEQPTSTQQTTSETADNTAQPATDSGTTPPSTTSKPALSQEEINNQAAQTADLLIKGYDKIHMLGRYLGKIDDTDLMKKHTKGEIDLDYELPLESDKITTRDFFKEYNNGIDQNIVVTDEFKNNIRPPLIRECIKRGWLMNDGVYIITLLTEDVATKVSMLVGLKSTCNQVLDYCVQIMKQQKTNGRKPDSEVGKGEDAANDNGSDDQWRENG